MHLVAASVSVYRHVQGFKMILCRSFKGSFKGTLKGPSKGSFKFLQGRLVGPKEHHVVLCSNLGPWSFGPGLLYRGPWI